MHFLPNNATSSDMRFPTWHRLQHNLFFWRLKAYLGRDVWTCHYYTSWRHIAHELTHALMWHDCVHVMQISIFKPSSCFNIMASLQFQNNFIMHKLKQYWNVIRDLRSLLAVLTVRNYCLQMSPNIIRMPKELWCCVQDAKTRSAFTLILTGTYGAVFPL